MWRYPVPYASEGATKAFRPKLLFNLFLSEVFLKLEFVCSLKIFLSPPSPLIMGFWSSMRFFISMILIVFQTSVFLCSLYMCMYECVVMQYILIIRTVWSPLVSFGHSRLVLDPVSYTWQCLTTRFSDPDSLVTTQVKTSLFHSKFMLWTRHFQM